MNKEVNIENSIKIEDYQRLIYISALQVYNIKTNESKEFFKDKSLRNKYLKLTSMIADNIIYGRVIDLEAEKEKNKDFDEDLYRKVFSYLLEEYRLAVDKEAFFKFIDKRMNERITKLALEETNLIKKKEKEENEKNKEEINIDDLDINEKMRLYIIDYLIKLIKIHFPDLSKDNEKIFKDQINEIVIREINGDYSGRKKTIYPTGLHCKNYPSPELENAFCSMNLGLEYDDDKKRLAASIVFPVDFSIDIENDKYVKATAYHKDDEYIFMTDEFKEFELPKILETENEKLKAYNNYLSSINPNDEDDYSWFI